MPDISGADISPSQHADEKRSTGVAIKTGNAIPVFVHSSWRTSSTWLWSKLRQARTTVAYYEIFHERLCDCSVDDFRQRDDSRPHSKHPEAAPYFLEFASLIEPQGIVRGFDRSMAFERFVPAGGLHGSLGADQEAYVNSLIQSAYARGKIPVLTDTRTLGRFNALVDAFPGRHVLLVRNAFHHWASYTEQWADGNDYFFAMLFKTIESSRHDPFIRVLVEWFANRERSPTNAATFQLFLLFHLYLYAHAFDAADLVLDVNKMAAEAEHRTVVERILAGYIDSPVDLSDVRNSFGLSLFSVERKTAFVDTIDQFVKQMIDGSISPQAREFLDRMKDEALAEWERHEFYAKAGRSAALQRLKLAGLRWEEQADGLNKEPSPPSSAATAEADLDEPLGRLDTLIAAAREGAQFVFHPTLKSALEQPKGRKIGDVQVWDSDDGRRALMLSGADLSASSAGETEGFVIRIPDSFEGEAGGRRLVIRVVAKSAAATTTRLAVAYSTKGDGTSGWRWFSVDKDWGAYEMTYDVPVKEKGGEDFIGLLADGVGAPGVLVCAVCASVM